MDRMPEIATFLRPECGKCEILCNSNENLLASPCFLLAFAPFPLHTPNGPRNAGFSSSPRPPHPKIVSASAWCVLRGMRASLSARMMPA